MEAWVISLGVGIVLQGSSGASRTDHGHVKQHLLRLEYSLSLNMRHFAQKIAGIGS